MNRRMFLRNSAIGMGAVQTLVSTILRRKH